MKVDLRRAMVALAAVAILAAACSSSDDDAVPATTTAPAATAAPETTAAPTTAAPETTAAPTTEAPTTTLGEIEATTTTMAEAEVDATSGGTLRYGLEADVDGLNPTASALSSPGLMMAAAVFDTLGVVGADGQCHPWLAESITSNDDFTSWTVTLRQGIKFHDGTDLTTEDVQVAFEAQLNDPLVGLAVKPFYPATEATTIVDDHTITFNLLDSWAKWCPATQLSMVPSSEWIAAALADPSLDQQPVGTGPFVFDSRSEDSVTRFVRNEDWWGGDVKLAAIEFMPVTDPSVRADLLIEGELDALQVSAVETVDLLTQQDGIQNVIDTNGSEGILMLNSAVAPFDDMRARQAFAYATPKQNYLDLITGGLGISADSIFRPGHPYHNPDVVQEADMPDEAAALAAAYCAEVPDSCTDGRINMEFQFAGPSVIATRTAEVLEQGWNTAFNVDFQELAQDMHIQETALGQYNAVSWRQFGAAIPEGDNVWLLCRTVGFISLNWPKYCDEERDAVIWQAAGSNDEAVRADAYKQLQQMLHDDYLYVFLVHTTWDNAFAANVHGLCDRVTPEGAPVLCTSGGSHGFDSIWMEQ